MTQIKNDNQKKSFKKKIFLVGLFTLAAGLVSYFGFQFWKKGKDEDSQPDASPEPLKSSPVKTNAKPNPTKAKPNSAKTNSTENPIPNGGNSAPKNQTKTQAVGDIKAALIAGAIHAAILKKDFTAAFNQLKFIKSVGDYSAVSKVFLKTRTAGIPQTLVGGLLSSFKTENQKTALKKAFTAMGLKYDGKKWSLSGIPGSHLLITTQPTKVWEDPQNFVQVAPNTVLGQEVAKRGAFSLFENDRRYFLVESKSVNYYNN